MTAFTEAEGTRIVQAIESIARSLEKIAKLNEGKVPIAYDDDGNPYVADRAREWMPMNTNSRTGYP